MSSHFHEGIGITAVERLTVDSKRRPQAIQGDGGFPIRPEALLRHAAQPAVVHRVAQGFVPADEDGLRP